MIYLLCIWCCACIYTCRPEGTRSHHRWFWAKMWVLGVELRTSGRAHLVFSCPSLSLSPFLPSLPPISFLLRKGFSISLTVLKYSVDHTSREHRYILVYAFLVLILKACTTTGWSQLHWCAPALGKEVSEMNSSSHSYIYSPILYWVIGQPWIGKLSQNKKILNVIVETVYFSTYKSLVMIWSIFVERLILIYWEQFGESEL